MYLKEAIKIPRHIINGQLTKLKFGSRGECLITMTVVNESKNTSTEVEFIIDTGFNGFLQLPENIITDLQLQIEDTRLSKAFDGTEKPVGITRSKVKLMESEISNFETQTAPIGAPALIGTMFLKALQMMLVIDFGTGHVTLTVEPKVRKKTIKAIEKYAA